jgi:hypothetical protein
VALPLSVRINTNTSPAIATLTVGAGFICSAAWLSAKATEPLRQKDPQIPQITIIAVIASFLVIY